MTHGIPSDEAIALVLAREQAQRESYARTRQEMHARHSRNRKKQSRQRGDDTKEKIK